MKQGELVSDFRVPPHPKGISIEGSLVSLKPLVANQFANELFHSNDCSTMPLCMVICSTLFLHCLNIVCSSRSLQSIPFILLLIMTVAETWDGTDSRVMPL